MFSGRISVSNETGSLKRSAARPRKEGLLARLNAQLEAHEITEPSPFLPLLLCICLYVRISFTFAMRPLWHDEIYTYYIAKSATLSHFMAAVSTLDLQPPLQYALTRLSFMAFGSSDFAARIPSLVAFLGGSLCLYHFVRYKLGRFYGLTAMLVLWLSPFLRYSAEARPYALTLGFFCLAMLGWQAAIEHRRRRLGVFGIAFGVSGMLMSHCFSPILVAILVLAEGVRSLEAREIDWPVYLGLLAPTPFVLLYLPLLRHFDAWTVIPLEFQASFLKIIAFYPDLLSAMATVLLVALIAGLIVGGAAPPPKCVKSPVACRHEIALVLGLLSLPALVNLLLMRTGGAFWPRYCLESAIGMSLLFVYVLAKLSSGSRAAAAIAAFCIGTGIASAFIVQGVTPTERTIVRTLSLYDLDPHLPLVTASGLTFLEMNKREKEALLSRVFYLQNRDAALRYAHATIFEGNEALRDYFPIRGTVEGYAEFVRRNPHFLVLGTPDYPEDWLIAKLIADGAELNFKGEIKPGYKDRMIFDVKLPRGTRF